MPISLKKIDYDPFAPAAESLPSEVETPALRKVDYDPFAEPEKRSVLGELGAAFGKGFYDSADTVLRSARVLGIDTSDYIKSIGNKQKPYEPTREGPFWDAITGGITSTVHSFTSGAPAIIGGGIAGGVPGAVAGFALSPLVLFSLAEYDQFMEEAEKSGIDRNAVKPQALISAIAEGGFESLSNLIGARVFGLIGKTPAGAAAKNAFKRFIVNTLKFQGAEQPSEMATAYIQTLERKKAGLLPDDINPWDSVKQVLGPVAVQGLLTGGVGTAAGRFRGKTEDIETRKKRLIDAAKEYEQAPQLQKVDYDPFEEQPPGEPPGSPPPAASPTPPVVPPTIIEGQAEQLPEEVQYAEEVTRQVGEGGEQEGIERGEEGPVRVRDDEKDREKEEAVTPEALADEFGLDYIGNANNVYTFRRMVGDKESTTSTIGYPTREKIQKAIEEQDRLFATTKTGPQEPTEPGEPGGKAVSGQTIEAEAPKAQEDSKETVKDEIDSIIEQYSATGRTATRYPRKKEISVDGRTMPEKDAIEKMRGVLESPAPVKEREPWEMSREEVVWEGYVPDGVSTDRALAGRLSRWEKIKLEAKDQGHSIEAVEQAITKEKARIERANAHRAAVERAISEGKITSHPDYPELKPPEKGKAPEETTQEAKAPQRGKIGGMLAAGEVVTTVSGRQTAPFPKNIDTTTNRKAANTVSRIDNWLIDEAVAEAKSRGDEFNLFQFENVTRKNITQADKDSAEQYLFGEKQPPVIPKITKPLVPKAPEKAKADPNLADLAAVTITQDAEVAETGKKIKIKRNAKEAVEEAREKKAALEKFLDCLS